MVSSFGPFVHVIVVPCIDENELAVIYCQENAKFL